MMSIILTCYKISSSFFLDLTAQYLAMAAVLSHLKIRGKTREIRDRSSSLLLVVLSISHVLLSQGYYHLIDLFQVGYYPSLNRISSNTHRPRLPSIQRITIDELGENEAREITGFAKPQLHLLFLYLRISDSIRDKYSDRLNCGEQSFLHYQVYNRLGVTKLQMSVFNFGADPRRFSYTIHSISFHLISTAPFIRNFPVIL